MPTNPATFLLRFSSLLHNCCLILPNGLLWSQREDLVFKLKSPPNQAPSLSSLELLLRQVMVGQFFFSLSLLFAKTYKFRLVMQNVRNVAIFLQIRRKSAGTKKSQILWNRFKPRPLQFFAYSGFFVLIVKRLEKSTNLENSRSTTKAISFLFLTDWDVKPKT